VSYQTRIIQEIFDAESSHHSLPGMKVYHNNFIENGIRALSITFSSVFALMDEGDFRALARAYLLAEPKTHFDWADYGVSFSDFIMTHPNLSEVPYLSEVAELDWLLQGVQRAKDKTFDGESFGLLNERDPNELVFETAPGFALARFVFPVDKLYQLAHEPQLQVEGETRSIFMDDLNKSMRDAINSEQARSIVVWRPDYKAEMLNVSDDVKEVFQHLHNQDSIANIFAAFAEQPEQLSPWLTEQISQKRLYGVRSTH
jgi:hypothetical protein